jgi:hypothetical protein
MISSVEQRRLRRTKNPLPRLITPKPRKGAGWAEPEDGEPRWGEMWVRRPSLLSSEASRMRPRGNSRGAAHAAQRRRSSAVVVILEVACHARGRGFESRRSRQKRPANLDILLPILAHTTAGFPTGHALIPHASMGRERLEQSAANRMFYRPFSARDES